MAKLVLKKLLLILLLLPLLSFAGFQYAVAHPRYNPYAGTSILSLNRFEGFEMPTYGDYLRGLAQGNWGEFNGTPVWDVVKGPLRDSLILLGSALVLSTLGGIIIGVWAISSRTLRAKPAVVLLINAVLSMPGFFLGVAVIGAFIYATMTGQLTKAPIPLSGYGLDEHLILPTVILASRPTMQIAKITANLMEHELQQDYVRVARSKGLGRLALFWQHAFPNILSAAAMTIAQSSRTLISGLIIVESLFLWPGIGRLFMYDIGIRSDGRSVWDFFAHPHLLAALAVLFGIMLLVTDLLASVAAFALDPRQRKPASNATTSG